MNSQKFYKCKNCGKIISFMNCLEKPEDCCGEGFEELAPNTVEAATEKHIPQVTVSGDTITVKVGSLEHPMLEEHHIEFIYLLTENGGQLKHLKIGESPAAAFKLVDDTAIAVYAYCNLHGLWKSEV